MSPASFAPLGAEGRNIASATGSAAAAGLKNTVDRRRNSLLRVSYRARFCLVSLGVLAAARPGLSARPIKIVVGFGPGGLGDITARAVAQKCRICSASRSWSRICRAPAARSPLRRWRARRPTATLCFWSAARMRIAPRCSRSMPYDWATIFRRSRPSGSSTSSSWSARTARSRIRRSIAAAKREPSRFNIGTISVGSVQNLSAHLFASMTGLQVTTVPFRTTGEIVTALLSDQVQLGFETTPGVHRPGSIGKLRALGVSSDNRYRSCRRSGRRRKRGPRLQAGVVERLRYSRQDAPRHRDAAKQGAGKALEAPDVRSGSLAQLRRARHAGGAAAYLRGGRGAMASRLSPMLTSSHSDPSRASDEDQR